MPSKLPNPPCRLIGAWLIALGWLLAACTSPVPPAPELVVVATPPPAARATPAPTSVPTPVPVRDRIAFVGRDDQIYAVDPDGANLSRVSPARPRSGGDAAEVAQVYNWPTWSPDGLRLAFTRLTLDDAGDPVAGEVLVAERAAPATARVYATDAGGPIYLAWSPDGGSLAMLVQEEDELRLLLGDGRSADARPVTTGSPLYFAWSPDSRRLLLHVGGDGRRGNASLSLFEAAQADAAPRRLRPVPNGFRAPAWFGDSQRGVWSVAVEQDDALLVGSPEDEVGRAALAPAGRAPAFVVSPRGDEVAFSAADTPGRPLYRGLSVQRPGETPRRLVEDFVVAFFWSPDGEHLAYAALDGAGDHLAWYVIGRAGGEPRLVHDFRPTRSFTQFLLYFDQYAQSMSIWSPDSRRLLVTTLEDDPTGGRTSAIYTVPIDGGDTIRLGEGKLAAWSHPTAVAAR